MSGILEIAPAGIPDRSLRLSPAAKNRSIATPTACSRTTGGARERSFEQRMFSKVARLLRRLTKTLHVDAPIHVARPAEQDRAIAEQDSDIAATAFIARISPVPGAARAAVREETTMSPNAAHTAIAAKPRGDMSAHVTWWQSLPQLFSRSRRALQTPSVPAMNSTAGILEVVGAHPTQWAFAPQAREFAVSRRLQSGGQVRPPRSPRVPRP